MAFRFLVLMVSGPSLAAAVRTHFDATERAAAIESTTGIDMNCPASILIVQHQSGKIRVAYNLVFRKLETLDATDRSGQISIEKHISK